MKWWLSGLIFLGASCQCLAQWLQPDTLTHRYFSVLLNETRNCKVILPPDYHSKPGQKYPVIYFLHGATVGYQGYEPLPTLVSILQKQKKLPPFIMVMPDGLAEPYNGSFYTNSELYGPHELSIISELIPSVDEHFRTLNGALYRSVMGHSMGGYGAFRLALRYPGTFVGAASHSGPLSVSQIEPFIEELKAEHNNQPPYSWDPQPGRDLTKLFFTMAGAFSPNLTDPKWVNFPLDNQGEIIQSVWQQWLDNDVSAWIRHRTRMIHTAFWFDCGRSDEYHLLLQNQAFADSMSQYRVPFFYEDYAGDHSSGLVLRIPQSLRFLSDLMLNRSITAYRFPGEGALELTPNPAREEIKIVATPFSVSDLFVSIRIFNLSGQLVIDQSQKAIPVSVDISKLIPGIYVLVLTDRHIVWTSKFVKSE